jgi:hypothetical protein
VRSIPIARAPENRSRKIHVDSAALTHQPFVDLCSKRQVLRPFCAQFFLALLLIAGIASARRIIEVAA